MPRTPPNSPNEIYEALKKLWFLDNTGKLLSWTFGKKQLMQNKMSKNYIYFYLLKNRNDVFNRYKVNTCKSTENENSIDTTLDNILRSFKLINEINTRCTSIK